MNRNLNVAVICAMIVVIATMLRGARVSAPAVDVIHDVGGQQWIIQLPTAVNGWSCAISTEKRVTEQVCEGDCALVKCVAY